MEEEDDFNYEGMTKIYVGEIKVAMVVMLKKRPCKITYYSACKTGKHGAAKAIIESTDIITDKRINYSASTVKSVWMPIVERKTFTWVDLQEDYLHVQNEDGKIFNFKIDLEDPYVKFIIQNSSNDKLIIIILFVIGEHRIVDARIEK